MAKNTKIIGFRGKKGVGKNFVASVVQEVLNNRIGQASEQGAFADPLKRFCMDALGLTYEQCYGSDSAKNTFTQYQWSSIPTRIRAKYPEKTGYMTAREVMQIFGTDIIRDCFGKDVWVNAMKRKIESSPAAYLLVTDVRFTNECEVIKSWGGQVWQINGPQRGEESAKGDSHPSETELDAKQEVDRIIINDLRSTREEIAGQVEAHLFNR